MTYNRAVYELYKKGTTIAVIAEMTRQFETEIAAMIHHEHLKEIRGQNVRQQRH